MSLDGAIDLHANHSVVVFRNEQDQVIDHHRFTNDLPEILAPSAPYQAEIQGVVV